MDLLNELGKYGTPEPIGSAMAVVRHPLGDETMLLEQLGLAPDDCTSVDFYCVLRDTGCFASVVFGETANSLAHRTTSDHGPFPHSFFIRRKEPFATKQSLLECVELIDQALS